MPRHLAAGTEWRKRASACDHARWRRIAPAVHPLVQVHPETRRKCLYFNDGQIVSVLGAEPQESAAIIAAPAQHASSPDGDYRHKWPRGEVVIWDNRCSIHCVHCVHCVHCATGDYPVNERRTN